MSLAPRFFSFADNLKQEAEARFLLGFSHKVNKKLSHAIVSDDDDDNDDDADGMHRADFS